MTIEKKVDHTNEPADPASWLPKVYFGSVDTPLPPIEPDPDPDPDDELLVVTPPDVVMMLGFDPLDLWDEDGNEIEDDDEIASEQ